MSKEARIKKEYNRLKTASLMPPAGSTFKSLDGAEYEVQADGRWKKTKAKDRK